MKETMLKDRERLQTLRSYEIMDTLPEPLYDEITQLAAAICNMPVSLISLLDDKRQYFKSYQGLEINQTPVEHSFCKYAIEDVEDVFIVEDASKDARFKQNPFVTSDPFVKFYAGIPLEVSGGMRLGALCVIDIKKNHLRPHQVNALRTLAKQVVQLFELRKSKKVTELQKERLAIKTERLQNVIKATDTGIWEWHVETGALELNQRFAEMLGTTLNGMKCRKMEDWMAWVHPADVKVLTHALDKARSQPQRFFDVNYRMKHVHGHWIWVNTKGKVMRQNQTGAPVVMYGTQMDITKTYDREMELQKTKNNLNTLINGTEDLLWSLDTHFNLIVANKAYKDLVLSITGRKTKPGDSVFFKEIEPETNEKWRAYYKRALQGERFSVKEKMENPQKPWVTYGLISLNPIFNNGNELIGVACYSKDITAEVLSQQVLLKSQQELEKIMDASRDIICTLNEEGHFVLVNRASKDIWGYEPHEMMGRSLTDFVNAADKDRTQRAVTDLVWGHNIDGFENRITHKEGKQVPMLWSVNWHDKDALIYCIARDITEKKKAEEQLLFSEQRFRSLVQEGSELIGIIDDQANYTYVSPTSTKVLQITPEEFQNKNAFDFIHPEDNDRVFEAFKTLAKNRQITIHPFRFRHKDGSWRWIETKATNLLEHSAVKGIVTNSRDVTEKVEHLRAIEEQNRKLREIAWTQSHVVRAPVARLKGLIPLVQEENDPEEHRKLMEFILASAEEIDVVIKEIVEKTYSVVHVDGER